MYYFNRYIKVAVNVTDPAVIWNGFIGKPRFLFVYNKVEITDKWTDNKGRGPKMLFRCYKIDVCKTLMPPFPNIFE